MTVRFNAQVFLFEFKVVELIPEGKALQQLQDKATPTNTAPVASRFT
jgi:hypothetical protein